MAKTLKQEFRIDAGSFPVDIDSFETNGKIVTDIETNTLYKPFEPILKFLRRMSMDTPFAEFFQNVDSTIFKICQRNSKGGASTPALNLRKNNSGGANIDKQPTLYVKGFSHYKEKVSPNQQKPGGKAKKSIVRLYPGEVKDSGV